MFKSMLAQANQTQSSSRVRAYLALGLGVLILGMSAIFVALAGAPGPVSGFYRMALGWLMLTLIAAVRKKPARVSPAGLGWGALAGTFFGLDLIFWTTGIMVASPTKTTLLGNTAPLWVGLGTMLLFKERHGAKFWVGLGVALAGSVLVVGPEIFSGTDLGDSSLYGVASALFYGAFFLTAQHGRQQIDSLSFVRASSLASAVVLLLTALVLKQPLTGYSWQTFGWFLAMGVVVQATGWLIITYAQGHLPAAIVSPTLLGQPVLTALFSALLLGERFTLIEAFGGAAVLLGVLLVNLNRKET
jgi:drug/metabolite transporter (DMT)-like permease